MSHFMRESVFRVSDQVRHNQGCTTTADDKQFDILHFKKEEGLYYLCSENKDADQLRSFQAADLRLYF